MKLTFLGAAHEVTGSMTLVEAGGARLLVDCGMEQGRDTFVNQSLGVPAESIDAVLLTHAHIDHSGNLPLLYKQGFRGRVYATRASCALADIMLRDCAHIQEGDSFWRNRKRKRASEPDLMPLYTMNDAEGLLRLLRPVDYGERLRILEGVEVRFTDVGHLIGSAAVETWLTEGGITKKFVFSGDIGNRMKPLLKDPQTIDDADYVLIESTYGDRLHEKVECDYVGLIADVISRTLDRGGNVIIPSFAVGRTQEILYLIRLAKLEGRIKNHDRFRVVVDSPLAEEATSVFLQSDPSFFDEKTSALLERGVNPLYFDGLEPSVSAEESRRLNDDPEPKVIISASGMCEAGRIRHHLKHNLWRAESTVLFVGYQTAGTLGRIILDGVQSVKLFGETIAVRAEIAFLHGSSGHADRDGLVAWLEGFKTKPARVFVNHGDDEVCDLFARFIREKLGLDAVAPYSGTEFDPIENTLVRITDGVPVRCDDGTGSKGQLRAKKLDRELDEAFDGLGRLVRSFRTMPNGEKEALVKALRAVIEKHGETVRDEG